MKKLLKAYRRANDSLKERPDFLLGALFGLIAMAVAFIPMIELGGVWIDAPKPSDLPSMLLGVGRLGLSVFAGISLGILIGTLFMTWAWHAFKRAPKMRAKYPDWQPDDA